MSVNIEGDTEMLVHEDKFLKYCDRMYEIVQGRSPKHKHMNKAEIFEEFNKVVECQNEMKMNAYATKLVKELEALDAPFKKGSGDLHVLTSIPIIDILINID